MRKREPLITLIRTDDTDEERREEEPPFDGIDAYMLRWRSGQAPYMKGTDNMDEEKRKKTYV